MSVPGQWLLIPTHHLPRFEGNVSMTRITAFSLLLSVGLFQASVSAAQFEVFQEKDGVTVKLNGKLFTSYLIKTGAKPILWPVIGPTGKEMTRAYPLREASADEKADHIHHRSFWFTHGDVNGIDFWGEVKGHGNIVHKKFLKVAGGETAVIITENDWNGPDGKKFCEDIRTFTFGTDGKSRWIDLDVTVKATAGEVKFGDTKEGCFGVRTAGTMKVTSEKGGTIINSEGQKDKEAWGKRAKWVDYYGPVDGVTVGIAIFNHPSSLRYPTYWHVRTYGLFTANPFGLHHFKKDDKYDGSLTLKPGESFTLRHRVLFHLGNEQEGKVAEAFAKYAKLLKEGP